MAMAVANRYARALADVVAKTGDYRKCLNELKDFAAAYRESAELRELFETPAVALGEKSNVLAAIAGRLACSGTTTNFLRVLLTNYRMSLLEEIVEAFGKIADDRLGIVAVKVSSAAPFSDADHQSLRARFAALTGKQVELEFRIEEGLLGGIRAQIESTVYDGTVRGHLERFRETLMGR